MTVREPWKLPYKVSQKVLVYRKYFYTYNDAFDGITGEKNDDSEQKGKTPILILRACVIDAKDPHPEIVKLAKNEMMTAYDKWLPSEFPFFVVIHQPVQEVSGLKIKSKTEIKVEVDARLWDHLEKHAG
jgi:hypothetical protein